MSPHDSDFQDSGLKLSPLKCPPPLSCKTKYISFPSELGTCPNDQLIVSSHAGGLFNASWNCALPPDGVQATPR